jgi:RNA polymerase primary sigma factor
LNVIDAMLEGAARAPLLSRSKEVELAKRIERGDLEAKRILIESNMRWVIAIAKNYYGRRMPFEEIIQEGYVGLIRAAEKFDWRKGFKFSTYSAYWIREAIGRAIDNNSRTVRLPINIAQANRRAMLKERELTAKLGREHTDEEIAKAIEIPIAKYLDMKRADQPPTSTDLPVGRSKDETILNFYKTPTPSVYDEVSEAESNDIISRAMDTLADEERTIVHMRYVESASLHDVASALGIKPNEVRSRERQALKKLERLPAIAALRGV